VYITNHWVPHIYGSIRQCNDNEALLLSKWVYLGLVLTIGYFGYSFSVSISAYKIAKQWHTTPTLNWKTSVICCRCLIVGQSVTTGAMTNRFKDWLCMWYEIDIMKWCLTIKSICWNEYVLNFSQNMWTSKA